PRRAALARRASALALRLARRRRHELSSALACLQRTDLRREESVRLLCERQVLRSARELHATSGLGRVAANAPDLWSLCTASAASSPLLASPPLQLLMARGGINRERRETSKRKSQSRREKRRRRRRLGRLSAPSLSAAGASSLRSRSGARCSDGGGG